MKLKKITFLTIFSVIILTVFSVNKIEAAVFLGCGERPLDNDCGIVATDQSLIICESSVWCMAVSYDVSALTGAYSFAVDSCDTGDRHCRKDNCSGIIASDGDVCITAAGIGGWLGGCDSNPQDVGVWNESESECVLCNGNREDEVCGDNFGVYSSTAGCGSGDGRFESACGADDACDERNSGEACVVGDVCDSRGDLCVAGETCDTSGLCVSMVVCNNDGICGAGETTANCPNDCCVNTSCGLGCTDPANCLTIEPDCIGFCIPAFSGCDPDCASAASSENCGPAIGVPCNPVASKISNLIEAAIVVIQYILSLIGLVALLFIIIAGIKYMLSIGNEEKMRSAKNTFTASAIGLSVAFAAYGILSVINYILGG